VHEGPNSSRDTGNPVGTPRRANTVSFSVKDKVTLARMREKKSSIAMIAGILFPGLCFAQSIPTVSNAPGEMRNFTGPGSPILSVGQCKFSINIQAGQRAIFNGPDLVLYYSKTRQDQMPYLLQAETNFGYAWSFKKKGSRRDKWVGVMCENMEDFSKITVANEISKKDHSPALDEIRQSNDMKCPATLEAGKWTPHPILKKGEDYLFSAISGDGWTGFLIGYRASKERGELTSVRFCMINENHVLVGAAEDDDRPLALPIHFFDELGRSLSTIQFPK